MKKKILFILFIILSILFDPIFITIIIIGIIPAIICIIYYEKRNNLYEAE